MMKVVFHERSISGLVWPVMALLMGACGFGPDPTVDQTIAFDGPAHNPLMRTSSQTQAGEPVAPPSNQPDPEFTPDEEIYFTDPDDPDSSLPELSAILTEAPNQHGPWWDSITIAQRMSVREGKPLLIWFTDSRRSPVCKILSRELFSTPEFEKWADEHLIRLRVDASADGSDLDLPLSEQESRRASIKSYVSRLKKQYRIMGNPSLILLNTDGSIAGRYRGYHQGESDFTWGLIKQGVVAANHAHKAWRNDLEKKGYREWSDREGRSVFAKLVRYKQGKLTLVEPDGSRSQTSEKKLSAADRRWIDEQKRRRGID